MLFAQRKITKNNQLTKNRQKIVQSTDIYYIGYITIKKIDDCENIYRVNTLYLLVNHSSGYIEGNGNKYLIFDDSVSENKGC